MNLTIFPTRQPLGICRQILLPQVNSLELFIIQQPSSGTLQLLSPPLAFRCPDLDPILQVASEQSRRGKGYHPLLGGWHTSNNVTNGGPGFWKTEASTIIVYWDKELKINCGSKYLEWKKLGTQKVGKPWTLSFISFMANQPLEVPKILITSWEHHVNPF